jgi:hypothetical protein
MGAFPIHDPDPLNVPKLSGQQLALLHRHGEVRALQRYTTVHWVRLWQPSRRSGSPLKVCGQSDPAVRNPRVIRYPQGTDPEQLTREYTTSSDFAADMAGFDPNEIVDVQSVLLDPTPF